MSETGTEQPIEEVMDEAAIENAARAMAAWDSAKLCNGEPYPWNLRAADAKGTYLELARIAKEFL